MFGAKLSWCQIVRCQIVMVPNCPAAKLSGAKLSGAKLSYHPPHSGNARKKTFFFNGSLPLVIQLDDISTLYWDLYIDHLKI